MSKPIKNKEIKLFIRERMAKKNPGIGLLEFKANSIFNQLKREIKNIKSMEDRKKFLGFFLETYDGSLEL